jgi:predicted HAD superfamily Cof-like phosphohydrolase
MKNKQREFEKLVEKLKKQLNAEGLLVSSKKGMSMEVYACANNEYDATNLMFNTLRWVSERTKKILLSKQYDQDVIPTIDNLILALSAVTNKINEK